MVSLVKGPLTPVSGDHCIWITDTCPCVVPVLLVKVKYSVYMTYIFFPLIY